MRNHAVMVLLCVGTVCLFSCKRKIIEPANSALQGKIVLKFDNIVGTQTLIRGETYINPLTGESFQVTSLRYFVSNIKLHKADGSEYVVPQDDSYFLIDEEKSNSKRIVINVPENDYVSVTFIIGVDSLRNTMPLDKRKGALDISGEAQGMYWTWNSGYIFFFFEGISPQLNHQDEEFRYHIGFYGGYSTPTLNNIRSTTLDFGRDVAKVRKDKTPEVHIMLDLLRVFNGSTFVLKIAENQEIMFSPISAKIADNVKEAFFYDHIHN